MTRDGLINKPTVTVAPCVTCRALTNAPVPVRFVASDRGPGTTLWACPSHAADLAPGPMPGELEQDA